MNEQKVNYTVNTWESAKSKEKPSPLLQSVAKRLNEGLSDFGKSKLLNNSLITALKDGRAEEVSSLLDTIRVNKIRVNISDPATIINLPRRLRPLKSF